MINTLKCRALVLAAMAFSGPAAAQQAPLVNDYGSAGLWQTPSGRFAQDGGFAAGVVHNPPYDRLFLVLQALPWAEAAFRYTDITNRDYSPDANFSGTQSYKDRGFDLRLRLSEESANWPAIALGFRDLGGTQLFDAQYLVANRRFGSVDASLGLGWGRLGAGGPISNPLHHTVAANDNQPGSFNFKRLYSSENIGVFGGVNWTTPLPGLDVAVEYDANNFKNEPLDNDQNVRLPINFGVKYRLPWGLQTGLSYQRGRTFNFTVAAATNFGRSASMPKVLDPAPPRLNPATSTLAPELAVKAALDQQKIPLESFSLSADNTQASMVIGPSRYRDTSKGLGRAARAAALSLPASVTRLQITESLGGVALYTATIQPQALISAADGKISGEEFDRHFSIQPAAVPLPTASATSQNFGSSFPRASWSINPSLRSQIGGPDGFFIGQLWLRAGASALLAPGLSVSGELGLSLYDNFNKLKLQSDSTLPHVRSDIVHYLREGRTSLVRLETNYIHQLAPTVYGRVSAGLFEEMFGGVAAEVLWRPNDPRFALGVNVNRVKQRDYDQRFSFRPYEVTTGNLTGYFEMADPSVLLKVSVGRYLAGDTGGTVDISRQFGSGMRVGVFATKTNVSAEQFGEGSFDKGFYVVLPFDIMLPYSNRSSGGFLFRPLTRDGGQMVRDGNGLYDYTRDAATVRMPERDGSFFE